MKIYPQNLRDRQHAEIIKRRSWGVTTKDVPDGYAAVREVPEPQMGKLGRLWASKSGLSEKQAATGLPASSLSTQGTMWGIPSMVGFISGIVGMAVVKKAGVPAELYFSLWVAGNAGLAYLSAVPWAASAFRSLYKKPLKETEIEALMERAENELERSYLTLVRDAIRQEVPEQSAEDIQTAIQALGEAIDRLPTLTVQPVDTDALHAEAAALRAEAAREGGDRVIGESKERRADALQRRADAHQRSALYVNRSAALRAEIEAQIEALREGLAAFNAGLSVTGDMAHLSESARRVAAEAVSTADAREEIEALLGGGGGSATATSGQGPVAVVRAGSRT